MLLVSCSSCSARLGALSITVCIFAQKLETLQEEEEEEEEEDDDDDDDDDRRGRDGYLARGYVE